MSAGDYWYLFILIPAAVLTVFVGGAVGIMKLQRMSNDAVSGAGRSQHVLRVGLPTTARVLDANDTGTRVDRIFIITHLRLQVDAAGAVPGFETSIDVPLSPVRLPQFAPGQIVKVKVDPATHHVAIDQPRQ
ncbi:hypothetical protein [Variovorax gossypii]